MIQFKEGDWRGWLAALAVSLVLVGLASAPPFLPVSIRPWIMEVFAGVCHQIPSRSFHIDGVPLAVCHRCIGIYLGFPIAGFLFLFLKGAWPFSSKTAPFVLMLSALPAGLDWGLDFIGWWSNTPTSRFATGLVLGTVAGYFFTAALAEGFKQKPKPSSLSPVSKHVISAPKATQ